MNRSRTWALALSAALAAPMISPLWAHEMGTPMEGHGEWRGRAEHWREALGLTEPQETKLKALREEARTALKPLRRKQRDLLIKLHDQLEDKAGDSEIKSTLAEIRSTRETLRDQAKRFIAQKDAILTPTQQAKMMMERMHRRRPMGMRGFEKRGEAFHHGDSRGARPGDDRDGDGPGEP